MPEKCIKCRYKQYYGKNIFPCTKCDLKKLDKPVTCYDCRYAEIGGTCKKGIRPCDRFEWS